MEFGERFDLKKAIDLWADATFDADSFLEEDKSELKDEVFEQIKALIDEKQFSPIEAYARATLHMTNNKDLKKDMAKVNEDNFQLKKVVLIFGGVIFYIFSYHFILCVNRLLLIVSNHLNGNIEQNVANVTTFFNVVYFITLTSMAAIYYWHKPAKWLFEKVTAKTSNNVLIIIATFAVVVLEMYLLPQVRNFVDEAAYRSLFFNKEVIFRYIHFGLITLSYILIFKRYTKIFNKV